MKTTPYVNLPQYDDHDPQDLRDGYNRAMTILDRKIQNLDQKIQSLQNQKGE